MDMHSLKDMHPLKRIRKRHGLTQAQLAHLAGISSLWLSTVECCGTESLPNQLCGVLSTLGYDVEQLRQDITAYREKLRQAELARLISTGGQQRTS